MTAAAPALPAHAAGAASAPARAGGSPEASAGDGAPADLFALLLDGLCAGATPDEATQEADAARGPAAPSSDAPAEAAAGRPHAPPGGADGLPAAWLQALGLPAPRTAAPPTVAAAQHPPRGAPAAATEGAATAAVPPDLLAAASAAATGGAAQPPGAGHAATGAFAAALASVDAAPATGSHAAHSPQDGGTLTPAPAGAAPAPLPAPEAAAVHQAALPTHPLDAAFAGDLGAQVQWMVDAGAQHAQLHLHPADLGPIHVQLTLHAQTADISFAAAHAATREGLAQELPALRDLLATQGLQLGQAGISAGQQGMQGGQGGTGREPPPRPLPAAGAATAGPVGGSAARRAGSVVLRGGHGMLDLYA